MRRILGLALSLLLLVGIATPLLPTPAHAQDGYVIMAYLTWGNIDEDWAGDASTLGSEPSLGYLTDLVGPAIIPVSTTNVTIVGMYGGSLSVFTNIRNATDNYSINSLPYLYLSSSDLETIVNNGLLSAMTSNITDMIATYNLDGIVLDIEGANNTTDVSALIDGLYTVLNPLGKVIDFAGVGYQYAPDSVLIPNVAVADAAKLRYVQVMCYDLWAYSDQTAGYPHATIADSTAGMAAWVAAGFDESQLLLGVPFYGRSPGGASTMEYDAIVAAITTTDAMDSALVSGTLYWWGGPDTDRAKANVVIDNGYAGVMAFALGYDALNTDDSLLLAIYEELVGALPPPGPVTLSSLTISPTSLTLAAGSTQQFSALGTYSDNSVANLTASVTWNSSNPTAASITTGGLVTGLAVGGTTTITASLSGKVSNTVSVTVTAMGGMPTIPQPVYTTDQIVGVGSFADLAEDGDVSISFHWDLSSYSTNGTYPETPASLSIIFQLLSTDNTTILSTATPYVYAPFGTNGYGHGVSAFYFSAADNLTWGQAYIIRIVQNPTYFESPTTQSYSMAAADWIGDQDDMYDWYIQRCDFLLAEYPTVNLKASTDIGLVFSTYGEAYFRAAVPGIQLLCPQLFYIQDYLPTEMTVTPYNTDLQDLYSVRMQTSEIKRGADRLMAHFGLEGYFGLGFAVLAACIGAGIYTSKKGWGLEPGLIGASLISVAGAVLIGNAVFTIVMVGSLVAVIALMFTWVGRRA